MSRGANVVDYPSPESFLDVETIKYELTRIGATAYFDPSVLASITMESGPRRMEGEVSVRIMGLVATWREQRLLKTPANWWQHFKERWFPAWALKRWPVLYEYHDAAVILPRVPIVNPNYHTVEFPVWNRGEGP